MKTSPRVSITTRGAIAAALALAACGAAEREPTAAEQASVSAPAATPPVAPAPAAEPRSDQRAEGRGHRGPRNPEKLIERFDTNKNGTLEAGELPERMQGKLAEIDVNNDKLVSKDELFAHFKAKRAGHGQQRFAKKDSNGDGVLDAAELGTERWARLGAADANADQKLTREELRAAFESGKIKRPEHGKRGHGERDRGDHDSAPKK